MFSQPVSPQLFWNPPACPSPQQFSKFHFPPAKQFLNETMCKLSAHELEVWDFILFVIALFALTATIH